MSSRGEPRLVAVTLAYLLTAVTIVLYLRLLLVPAPAWYELVGAIFAIGAPAVGIRQLRRRSWRCVLVGLIAAGAVVASVGMRSGAWPWREDLRGADGYLGTGGYFDQIATVVAHAGAGWAAVTFPVDGSAEPDAATGVRLLLLFLLLASASTLIVFRMPLVAVVAVAIAGAIGTLFIGLQPLLLHGVLICLVALVVVAVATVRVRRRIATVVVAVGMLTLAATTVAIALGQPSSALFEWRQWSLEEPEPVSVGFVWKQSLAALDFGDEIVPVLEVGSPTVGYLRVATLGRFDGTRWQPDVSPTTSTVAAEVRLPQASLPAAARGDRGPSTSFEIRNLALASVDLPLPLGTESFSGLAAETRPVQISSTGSVRLAQPLPSGEVYTVTRVTNTSSPALLDADLLGAPTDPVRILIENFLNDPLGGRHSDRVSAGPWGADYSATTTAPTDQVTKLDRPRPSSGVFIPSEPETWSVPMAESDSEGIGSPAPAVVGSQPDPADLSFGGMVFPAFGEPGREAEVRRLFRDQRSAGTFAAISAAGWEQVYRNARARTAEATTPYQVAVMLEHWFQSEFRYDETVAYTADGLIGPLPAFLLSPRRAAHCQYFAGAMAALLRLLGVPSRVAVGFTAGRLDGDRRIITNRDAHAWVEVHFPYSGWVAFEPTPSRRLASSTSSTSALFAASAIALPGGALASVGVDGALPNGRGPNRGTTGVIPDQALAGTSEIARSWWWLVGRVLLVVLLVAVAGGVVIWVLKQARLARARRTQDPRLGALAARWEIAGWIGDQGVATQQVSTVELGRMVRTKYGVDAEAWVTAVVLARYGPEHASAEAFVLVQQQTRLLRRHLSRRASRRERLAGAVRPQRLLRRTSTHRH